MKQPGALIIEDRFGSVYHSRSGKRPYLAAVPLALVLAAVAIAGALGPRPSPSAARTSPAALTAGGSEAATGPATLGPSASVTAPPLAWSQPFYVPTPPPSSEPSADPGMARMTVFEDSILTAQVPGAYDGSAMAVAGQRFFLGQANQVLEVDLGGSGDLQEIKTFDDGHSVAALAASGDRLAVLEYGAPACGASCSLDYHVWLISLDDSSARQVGAFATPAGDSPTGAAQLALGRDSWAISRPSPRKGHPFAAAIEVHADSGKLLWSTSADVGVLKLMLGGQSVVVIMGPQTGTRPVAVANAVNPKLVEVGAFADASISADGRYLAWDDGSCVESWLSGVTIPICPMTIDGVFHSPSVDATNDGLMNAVWLVDTGDTRHLVVRAPRLGSDYLVTNAESPDWAIVQGDLVIWGTWSKAGIAINEFDVSTANYQID